MTEAASAARRGISAQATASVPFEAFVEAAPDAVVLIDGDGRIVAVNAQTEKLFDFSRHELIGGPVERLLPERFHEAHVGHRAAYRADPPSADRLLGPRTATEARRVFQADHPWF